MREGKIGKPFGNLKEEKGKNEEKTGIRQEDEREPAGGKKEGNKKRRAMPPFCFPQNGLSPMKNKIENNNDDDSTYNRLYDASYRTG